MKSWGIFGLSDVAWLSKSEIMLGSSRRMYWKSVNRSYRGCGAVVAVEAVVPVVTIVALANVIVIAVVLLRPL